MLLETVKSQVLRISQGGSHSLVAFEAVLYYRLDAFIYTFELVELEKVLQQHSMLQH